MKFNIDEFLKPRVLAENNFEISSEFEDRIKHPLKNARICDTHALMLKTRYFSNAFDRAREHRRKRVAKMLARKDISLS